VLREVDLIACEDTRRTRALLSHFDIHTPTLSYYEHNKLARGPQILRRLAEGASVALVTDAGTPGISDPGFLLVRDARAAGIDVVPVPGPSAVATALSAAGVPADRFVFDGFLPVKPGNFVNAGDLLVQVADPSIVQVRAFVDEPDIGRLARGQKVQITWDALPGRVWEGTVTNVPTTVMLHSSRTVGEITAQVDNTDAKLLPNINVSVVVVTARVEARLLGRLRQEGIEVLLGEQ